MYCPSCEAEREFFTERRVETLVVRGVAVRQPVTLETCGACGEGLFDEKRDELLLRRAYALAGVQPGSRRQTRP